MDGWSSWVKLLGGVELRGECPGWMDVRTRPWQFLRPAGAFACCGWWRIRFDNLLEGGRAGQEGCGRESVPVESLEFRLTHTSSICIVLPWQVLLDGLDVVIAVLSGHEPVKQAKYGFHFYGDRS